MSSDVPIIGPSPTGDLATPDQIAAVFARMTGLLLMAETVHTALELVTSLATETISPTAAAGITLTDSDGGRVTVAATDPVVVRADALQYQLGSGPCLSSWADHVIVRIDDLAVDERWPSWSHQVSELGLRSSLSAPLVAGPRSLGALKVYAAHPDAFGGREEHLASMFASQAAMLLANMRAGEDAERATARFTDSLRSRDVITLAKGIIMGREGVDERVAFHTLIHAAGRQAITLRQAAEQLARSTVRRLR